MQQERAQKLLPLMIVCGLIQVGLGALSDTLLFAGFGLGYVLIGIAWLWSYW
ncbi:hypothetical protein HALLA_17035 [Halostagnicola larsenii XH-48]|uniref:Uncharacterized protein n=1 Tax=Halostagnicola larsenii XH-48 TaxID=797299 RepID=W0JQV7_9EURY|nr:hypothetical protein HALLA_17035 [Halostagnicola larsenii XH-48]